MINSERDSENRQRVYAEIAARAGSFEYLCRVCNRLIFCHHPVGPVLWHRAWSVEVWLWQPLSRRNDD